MQEIQAVKLNQLYASPNTLSQLYDLGMTHVYALLNAMRQDKKYKDEVVSYGKVTRVKLSAFDAFWREYARKH